MNKPSIEAQLVSRLVGDTIRYAPAVLVPALVSVSSVAVFTRLLAPASYGFYSIALAIVSIVAVVGAVWIEQAVLRYLPEYDAAQRSDELVGFALGATIATCAVVFVALAVAAATVSVEGLARLLLPVGALLVGEIGAITMGAVLQARLRARSVSTFRVCGAVLRFALALGFVLWIARDARWLLIGAAIGRGIATLTMFIVVARDRGRWVKPRLGVGALTHFAAYGVPMVGWALAGQLLAVSDRFIIGTFHGPGPVGTYSANYNLVSMGFGLLSTPLLMAAHPLIVSAWKHDERARISEMIESFSRLYVVVLTPLVVVLAVCHRDVAGIVLAEDYRGGSFVIPVLVLGSFAWGFAMYGHKALELTERTALMFQLAGVTAMVNIALNLMLIPRFGYPAAAFTTLASYLLYPVLVHRVAPEGMPWRIPWTTIARAGVAGLVAAGLALATRRVLGGAPPIVVVCTVTLVVTAAYAALLLAWRRFVRQGAP